MKLFNKLSDYTGMILLLGLVLVSCQKMDKPPALGADYPKDSNPPGGPLKFYAAMDGSVAVDSIRANFGNLHDASFVAGGVSGKALQLDGTKNGYASFATANDFGISSSFTISFWLNITLAQKDNGHAVGVLAFANSNSFWSNIVFYADNNTQGTTASMDLKIHFNDTNNSDNWNFANYNFANAWPNMYNGIWHQVAFTYDAVTKIGTVYRDGAQFDQKTNQSIKFENSSQLIIGGFQEAAGIQGDYPGNTWMAGFPGMIDQVRLYGTALTSAQIAALYTNKQ